MVGHGDWEAQNLRWHGQQPWTVHDWDSAVSAPEPVIVGLAASVWPSEAEPRAASVSESEAFLEAYQHAARRPWSADQIQASWAAGLWVYAFNAKKASLDAVARRVSDMLQRPVVSYTNGREIVITFGYQEAPALALRSPGSGEDAGPTV